MISTPIDERDFDRYLKYRELTGNGQTHYVACNMTGLSTHRVMELIDHFNFEMRNNIPYTHEIASVEEMALRMQGRWQEPPKIINQVVPVDRTSWEDLQLFYRNLKDTGRMIPEKLYPLKASA